MLEHGILDGIAVAEYNLDGRMQTILTENSDTLTVNSRTRVQTAIAGQKDDRLLLQDGIRIVRGRLGGDTIKAAYGGKKENILKSVEQIKAALKVIRDQDLKGLKAHYKLEDGVEVKDVPGWTGKLQNKHSWLVGVLCAEYLKPSEILKAAGWDADFNDLPEKDREGSLQTLYKLNGQRRKDAAEKKAAAAAAEDVEPIDPVVEAVQDIRDLGLDVEQIKALIKALQKEQKAMQDAILAAAEKKAAEEKEKKEKAA